mmetsp:Transcript_36588/g.89373  ORF Transcript_36588/g.89373 Transcript_36588/m.89373 type:complete len:98 (+) Transcript_36588:110-403(+)|eukprot:CAMPEP_0198314774 /NCGR_PEP_ID=MMETSP1450-20131203/5288_1 /TAXON_ID=753684 ORGANISM="Madagascaria erythrocladiodes, Strain CCMP3234" /NCGR_SAMPLE_ID=MMETSP1450 /ASSEMBLY_ACC=CAM_ASM_001115 /LENGTH=97 /DNA_ID=CAMNT_0044017853 /DNA_START=98 /DNA_END=391 /DNA_ORIENTATION=+
MLLLTALVLVVVVLATLAADSAVANPKPYAKRDADEQRQKKSKEVTAAEQRAKAIQRAEAAAREAAAEVARKGEEGKGKGRKRADKVTGDAGVAHGL